MQEVGVRASGSSTTSGRAGQTPEPRTLPDALIPSVTTGTKVTTGQAPSPGAFAPLFMSRCVRVSVCPGFRRSGRVCCCYTLRRQRVCSVRLSSSSDMAGPGSAPRRGGHAVVSSRPAHNPISRSCRRKPRSKRCKQMRCILPQAAFRVTAARGQPSCGRRARSERTAGR